MFTHTHKLYCKSVKTSEGSRQSLNTSLDASTVMGATLEEICSSSDAGVIPFGTQMHSCFSKYPHWKPPHSCQSPILISNLILLLLHG